MLSDGISIDSLLFVNEGDENWFYVIKIDNGFYWNIVFEKVLFILMDFYIVLWKVWEERLRDFGSYNLLLEV